MSEIDKPDGSDFRIKETSDQIDRIAAKILKRGNELPQNGPTDMDKGGGVSAINGMVEYIPGAGGAMVYSKDGATEIRLGNDRADAELRTGGPQEVKVLDENGPEKMAVSNETFRKLAAAALGPMRGAISEQGQREDEKNQAAEDRRFASFYKKVA